VPIPTFEVPDREQRIRSLTERLADPHQDSRGERDREPSGVLDRAEAHGGDLVGGAVMRQALLGEPLRPLLEHQSHGRGDLLESRHLLPRHDARVQMRQKARLLDHRDRGRANVVERRGEAALLEPCARLRVPILWPIAECEEGLGAAGAPARLRDLHDLLGR
jgi:hypothetical protein